MHVMLVHVQKIQEKKACADHFQLKLFSTEEDEETFSLCKRNLCSCIQMLQSNEFCTILSNSKYSLNVRNVQGNQFVVEVNTPTETHILYSVPDHSVPDQNTTPQLSSSTLPALLKYLQNQIIPQHKHCVFVSGQMQEIFGFVTHRISDNFILPRRVDDNFLLDNATNISKLADMLNCNLPSHMADSILCCKLPSESEQMMKLGNNMRPVITSAYAALQLKLAAIFCATALKDTSCMWHVSQNMMSDVSSEMLKVLYEKPPEKNCVTLLLKGESADERIYRINLAVRYFPVDHKFTTTMMPTVMALNASNSKTGVLVLTGVQNNIAAAIYHNSDTQTMLQNKITLAQYMGSL
jgi:hypothetical protein